MDNKLIIIVIKDVAAGGNPELQAAEDRIKDILLINREIIIK